MIIIIIHSSLCGLSTLSCIVFWKAGLPRSRYHSMWEFHSKQTFTIRNLYYWHCQCLCSFVLLVGCGVVANVEGHKRKLCWPHTLCKERVVQQKSFRCRNSLSQKNSHLNMTCREGGHSGGSFRSIFFLMWMMVIILPPTQYVVEEKLQRCKCS